VGGALRVVNVPSEQLLCADHLRRNYVPSPVAVERQAATVGRCRALTCSAPGIFVGDAPPEQAGGMEIRVGPLRMEDASVGPIRISRGMSVSSLPASSTGRT
jgi:hypothetical protein